MKHKRSQPGGYAILIVLIAAAILMLLYFVQIDAFFGPRQPGRQPTGIEQRPWLLEDRLVPEGGGVAIPNPPKPELNEPFEIAAPVSRNAAPRGQVVIAFAPDGRILARWECGWAEDERSNRIRAEMKGNIDAGRTYEDASGKDKSRLFFIAKGGYRKTAAGPGTDSAQEQGTAWLIGWLRPDRSAAGYITITTDQAWAAAYAFEAPAAKDRD
ncbi:MAG: hypothetical protein L0Y36_07610 [Planctomycetales bacterium]|nr:hypothetical protein [Planctomycetales bacterium]